MDLQRLSTSMFPLWVVDLVLLTAVGWWQAALGTRRGRLKLETRTVGRQTRLGVRRTANLRDPLGAWGGVPSERLTGSMDDTVKAIQHSTVYPNGKKASSQRVEFLNVMSALQ